MTYESFKHIVRAYCARAGLPVKFKQEDGKFIAVCDDIKFVGNSSSRRPAVLWGDGHVALIPTTEVC